MPKVIGEVFQDYRRIFLDKRNEIIKNSDVKPDIVFIGDSITEAFNFSYAGISKYTIVNSGISGDRVRNLHHRIYPDAIDLKPSKVVIMIGINDLLSEEPNTLENYEENIQSLFNEYKKNVEELLANNIDVVCCGVIRIFKWEHNTVFINEQINLYNSLIQELCSQHNLTFVDYNEVLGNRFGGLDTTFTKDGLHPDETGYFEMFKLLQSKEIV